MAPFNSGMLQRERGNKPSPNTRALSIALRSVWMAARSPVGVPMAPFNSGMLQRGRGNKPSPTRAVSLALRSARMDRPSLVGVGGKSVCGML